MPSALRTPAALRSLRLSTTTRTRTARPFTTTLRSLADSPPPGNQPPSAKSSNRSSQPVTDQQSSASSKDPDEHKSGDDHPAKQPDTQAPSERSTGFHEGGVEGGVKGGKEGIEQGARSDK